MPWTSAFVFLLALQGIHGRGHDTHPRRRHHHGVSRLNQTAVELETITTIPTGWSLYTTTGNDGAGCYVDQSKRLVPAYEVDVSKDGVKGCLSTCQEKGYLWATVQNGEQCYCASSLGLTITSAIGSECSITCSADDTACQPRLKVYKYSRPTPLSKRDETAQWTYQGCTADPAGRVLPFEVDNVNMSPGMCISTCSGLGYNYAGIEFGVQCFCGHSLGDGAGYLPESACDKKCMGSMRGCGGGHALSLWQVAVASDPYAAPPPIVGGVSGSGGSQAISGSGIATALASGASTGTATSTTTLTGSAAIAAASSASVASVASAAATTANLPTTTQPATSIPASGNTKYVWAHHMVGNTYPYGWGDWANDIGMAQGAGIDGFILNIGSDSWQPARVADAYSAAQAAGFKMMLSLDMSVFGCGDWSSVPTIQSYLDNYLWHAAAAKVNGKSALTTFAGDSCTFSQGNTNAGWAAVFGNRASSIYFMPAYFGGTSALSSYNIQAEVNWDGAWPMGSSDIDTGSDWGYMGSLQGKGYVATISPLFYTHLAYKNWLYRSDDWLFAMRWEQVIGMRAQIDQVEIVTWNDYGESHYIGPINGALPSGSEQYATQSLPHTDILSLNAFYAQAWKTGYYPAITYDQVWVMARPHAAGATASSDPYGMPTGAGNSQDKFYAQVHLTGPASVTLCSGACQTFAGNAGINRFSQALQVGSGMSVKVVRAGQTTVSLSPDFTFDGSPSQYNFNYLIKSS